MSIYLLFQFGQFTNFKHFYLHYVSKHMNDLFPQQLKIPYYSYGIKNIEYSPKQTMLVASPEKALCDKVVLTPKIYLRSIKQTREFLIEDLRMDSEVLSTLDTKVIELWIKNAPKKSNLKMLIKR